MTDCTGSPACMFTFSLMQASRSDSVLKSSGTDVITDNYRSVEIMCCSINAARHNIGFKENNEISLFCYCYFSVPSPVHVYYCMRDGFYWMWPLGLRHCLCSSSFLLSYRCETSDFFSQTRGRVRRGLLPPSRCPTMFTQESQSHFNPFG